MQNLIKLGISLGDPNGIGPEVSLKTLLNIDLSQSTPIVAAPHHLVQRLIKDQKSSFSTSSNPLPTLHSITDENELVDGAIHVLESFASWSDLDFSISNYGPHNSLVGMLSMQ